MRRSVHTAVWTAIVALVTLGAARDLPLVDAVRQNDVRAVRTLLNNHVDVNSRDPDGSTALAWAVYEDNPEVAALLITAGADVNAANDYGETPLSVASQNRSVSMVEQLLVAGANADAAKPSGETVLMTAVDTGAVEIVKRLIAKGANVNTKETIKGQTALMWAAANGSLSIVNELVAAGADVDATSAGGSTALHFAVQSGAVEIARVLLERGGNSNAKLSVRQIDQEIQPFVETLVNVTPLWIAIATRNEDMGILLLHRGADPNAGEYRNISPLHFAVQARLAKLVPALVAAGADVNARVPASALPLKGADEFLSGHRSFYVMPVGATPFLIAAQVHDPSLMRELLAAGADPRIRAADETTPLMAASGLGDEKFRPAGRRRVNVEDTIQAITIALEHGGDVNAVNDAGQTALHGAVTARANDTVKFLLERGARIDVKDKDGKTPLDVAEQEQSTSTADAERQRVRAIVELLKRSAG
jgi:ankyrin repeat protein